MAYEGEISYLKIPLGLVEWSNAVHGCFSHKVQDGLNHLFSVELKATVRKFSLNEIERQLLIFDENDRSDIQRLRCIFIGRERAKRLVNEPKQNIMYWLSSR